MTDRKMIKSRNPATGELLGEVAAWSVERITAAVEQARLAQKEWAALSFTERRRRLLPAQQFIVDHQREIAELITRENGKPITEAYSSDMFPVLYLFDYFRRSSAAFLREESIDIRIWKLLLRRSTISRSPRGVALIIAPWNYPFSIPMGEMIMALMAGNAVLLKPSRETALIGEKISEIFAAADLPQGLVHVVQGSGRDVLKQNVDFIAFTGSVETGRLIAVETGRRLIPAMLELGGKDPMIVLEDADIEVAAGAAVWGAFTNAGQVCASVERLYIHESIYDSFVDKLLAKTKKLRQGDGTCPETDIGPMNNQAQFDLVAAQVEDARANGARILCGGRQNVKIGGLFYEPTLITEVDHGFRIMKEETFGPVLGIMRFKDEDEAVTLANDSDFGLTASVWSRDLRRAKALARRIESGTVMINDCVFSHAMAETPWGGLKDSGIGRTHSKWGLQDFTEMRHIHVNSLAGMKNPWVFPYGEELITVFSGAVNLFTHGILRKVTSLPAIATNFLKVFRTRL